MTEHLSDAQFENYRLRRADSAEMVDMAQHLAGCAECRETLLKRRTAALVANLSDVRPQHISYEELEAYVDGRAGSIERELVDSHVEWCENCAEQLRTLQQCAALMDAAAPDPHVPRPPWEREMIAAAAVPRAMAQSAMPAYITSPPSPPPQRKNRWPVFLVLLLVLLLAVWILFRR